MDVARLLGSAFLTWLPSPLLTSQAAAESSAAEAEAARAAKEQAALGVTDLIKQCKTMNPDKSELLVDLEERWLDAVADNEVRSSASCLPPLPHFLPLKSSPDMPSLFGRKRRSRRCKASYERSWAGSSCVWRCGRWCPT